MSFNDDYNCGSNFKNATFRDHLNSFLHILRKPNRCPLRMFIFKNQPEVFAGKFGKWNRW